MRARPEEMWASLIDFREKEPEVEGPVPEAESFPVRLWKPPWMSRTAIAAASLFGAVALGIVIYISIDKNGFKFFMSRDNASAARDKGKVESDPARAGERHVPAGGSPQDRTAGGAEWPPRSVSKPSQALVGKLTRATRRGPAWE